MLILVLLADTCSVDPHNLLILIGMMLLDPDHFPLTLGQNCSLSQRLTALSPGQPGLATPGHAHWTGREMKVDGAEAEVMAAHDVVAGVTGDGQCGGLMTHVRGSTPSCREISFTVKLD